MISTSSSGRVSEKEDSILSVDGLGADELIGRYLGLQPGKDYDGGGGMTPFSSLYLKKFL